MRQIELIYSRLQDLSPKTLVQIIDELSLPMPDNEYTQMATDVYERAKAGDSLTHKQKRVLVNIIGQLN